MKKTYKLAVFIGRFQPFHAGHRAAVNCAMLAATQVLILVGSANKARTPKNPWTFNERAEMIRAHFPDGNRVSVRPLADNRYNESQWMQDVQSNVQAMGVADEDVLLIGHKKDGSSYYLDSFKWERLDCGFFPLGSSRTIDATKIRELFFEEHTAYLDSVVSPEVLSIMHNADDLKVEHQQLKAYKQLWVTAPFPPTFVTTDAVVMQSGHILLIRRKDAPGKGLWALPGGFLGETETVFDSCIRELREETGIKVPEIILRKAKAGYQYFDDPARSLRGRTITHAFFFKLDDAQELPHIRGNDDADKAQWFSLAEIENMSTRIFEDHFDIIEYFKNRATK